MKITFTEHWRTDSVAFNSLFFDLVDPNDVDDIQIDDIDWNRKQTPHNGGSHSVELEIFCKFPVSYFI